MKRIWLAILCLALTLPLYGGRWGKPVGGPCCLCECRSANQDKCTMYCRVLQHSKKIVEEPQIHVCTRKCERAKVQQLPSDKEPLK